MEKNNPVIPMFSKAERLRSERIQFNEDSKGMTVFAANALAQSVQVMESEGLLDSSFSPEEEDLDDPKSCIGRSSD